MTLAILDLFSGIGGFSLGLERTGGFRTVAFCERDAYATAVLNRHWPGVPVFSDVCGVGAGSLRAAGIAPPDVVCGGFPCQDISLAGAGAGLDGARSGLWFEMLRIVAETRPRFVIAENVAALRSRGLGEVLRGLSEIGYDAEWHCIPASAVGAPHRRDRIWIIAHAMRPGPHAGAQPGIHCGEARPGARHGEPERLCSALAPGIVADANGGGLERRTGEHVAGSGRAAPVAGAGGSAVAYPVRVGLEGSESAIPSALRRRFTDADKTVPHPHGAGLEIGQGVPGDAGPQLTSVIGSDWWAVEPDVGRVANGVPRRVDRLRCLGNAVVPQIPEMIGRAILSHVQRVSEKETGL